MNYPPQQGPHGPQPGPRPQGGYYPQQPPQWGWPQGANHPGGAHPQQQFWQQVAGGPPPGPPRRNRRGPVIGVLVASGLVLVAAVIALALALAPDEIEAGDCMSLQHERGGPMSSAECGASDSDYRVVSVQRGQDLGACGDDYANVYRDTTYCVVLDVRAGDCLTSFQEDVEILPLKVTCGSAQDQVTRIASGQDPETACRENEGYYVFSRETVCFAEVQGA
ncbi:hypothetical protein [Saccharopolyspora griseoalba]|uniref:Uncharacterized protein n=1 Tax=Saccharopolyspora griseoalba TaxID=1431848 RepID=A0ABW2LKB7_9PSEU